jgi:hypothetical protein
MQTPAGSTIAGHQVTKGKIQTSKKNTGNQFVAILAHSNFDQDTGDFIFHCGLLTFYCIAICPPTSKALGTWP